MRKLVLFAAPFSLAALVYAYLLSAFIGLLLGTVSAVCCVLFCTLRFRRKVPAALIAAGLAFGFLWSSCYELFILRPAWEQDGTEQDLELTVCAYPARTETGCKIEAQTVLNGRRTKILLYLHGTVPEAAPGDTVRVRADLSSTASTWKDANFYDLADGIALRAYGEEASITPCEKTPFRFLPAVFSERIRGSLSASVAPDAAGFLQALITGDRSGLPHKTQREISDAGFSHVIAVSGMHVAVLLGILRLLTLNHPTASAILGVPLLLFFVLMTGASASVARAAVMQIIVLFAPLLRRDTDTASSIGAALLVLLLINPYAITGISFQLSFASVIGIALCAERIRARLTKPEWVQKLLKIRWTKPPTDFFCSCLASTLGAMLLTVPLTALYFDSVGVYSLMSNLLVLSVISLCFSFGLVTGLLGLLWLPGAKLLGAIIAVPVRYVLWVASTVSKLPFAALSAKSPFISAWLLFAYVLLLLTVLPKEKRPFFLSGVCISVSFAVCLLYTYLDGHHSAFSVSVLDVGQGECILMQTPGYSAMVDCGGDGGNATADTAADALANAGSGELNSLILTHYDTDHTNGVVTLLSEVRVETLYLPDVEDDSGRRARIEAAAREAGTQIIYVTQDLFLRFSGGEIQIFAPVSYYDDNSACLSVLFSASEYDMLITGDMDFFSEYDLMLSHRLPDVELFIAGHHGSATSSSADLLAQIKPETVIVSVGKDNHYGHPSEEALDRFLAVGAEIYRTDECGTITVGR